MKTHVLVCLTCLVTLGVSSVRAATDPGPLAEFAGNYRGKVTLRVLGTPYAGKCHMQFAGPPSGNSSVATVKGTISDSMNTYDVGNVFRFGNQKFTVQRFLPPFADTPSPRGRLKTSRRSLQGSTRVVAGGPVGIAKVKATLQTTRRLAKVTLVYSVTTAGVPFYIYTYTGTRKLRPSD